MGHRLLRVSDFDSSEHFVRFSETRSNAIRLSPPRFVKTREPEGTLEALFQTLVGGDSSRLRSPGVNHKLTRALKQEGVLPLVRHGVEVTIHSIGKKFKASNGYQNGRFNLVHSKQFASSNDDQVLRKASLLAIEGKFLFDDGDPNLGLLRLVVVCEFSPSQVEARQHVEEIFRRNEVEMYTFDNLQLLLADIKANAGKQIDYQRSSQSKLV